MKQLLHVCENIFIVGLNDRAFVVQDSSVCELLAPENNANDNKDNKETKQHVPSANEIQAVAVSCIDNQVWCAVSRYNKTLTLYSFERNAPFSTSSMQPTSVHKTVKRVLCITFASVPSENDSSPLHVVVAGDLTGDATAYSLKQRQSRFLLGHTASMLTGVNVVSGKEKQYILTSDRDEKIRVSAFPQTTMIEGYLLGHENYITSMDATLKKCVSCGGDNTVRLWNYVDCNELGRVNVQHLPTRVAMSPDGMQVAVIYHGSNKLDIFKTNDDTSLELQQSIDCPSQPLSVKFVSNERILLVTGEPEYMSEYKLDAGGQCYTIDPSSPCVQALRQVAASENIAMPTTIMEVDQKSGQIKLQKEAETRVAVGVKAPWNKFERVQTAKEANKRREKRKRQAKEES